MMLLANAVDNLGYLGMSLLAVIGGAVAGAVVTMLVVSLLSRFVWKRKLPYAVRRLLRTMGAICGMLAVASVLKFGFGGGGSPWPFGGGPGSSGPSANANAANTDPTAVPSTQTRPLDANSEAAPLPAHRFRVVVLGGKLVQGAAFYRLDGQARALELKELQATIRDWQEANPKRAANLEIVLFQNSLDQKTDPVRQLQAWAAEHGLSPDLKLIESSIPD